LSDLDKATILNNCFCAGFTQDNDQTDLSYLPNDATGSIDGVFFTADTVLMYINRLNGNSSASPDGLPAIFFEHTTYNVAYPMSVIFNMSMQTGEIPKIWHFAIVTPVFKKGSPSDPTNYRPIYLTCISCKLLECGVKDALLKHFLVHRHGFLRKKIPHNY